MIIYINEKRFLEDYYENEADLEKVVVTNSKKIFGEKTIYIDVKKKIGKKSTRLKTIPDGYLINCVNPDKPELYIIENELSDKPNLNDHITVQIGRFISAIRTEPMELQSMIVDIIENHPELRQEIENLVIKNFRNAEQAISNIFKENRIRILVIIDSETSDLNKILDIFSSLRPEVIELKRFRNENDSIYIFTEFQEGIEDFSKETKKDIDQIDTIICPAREEGFKEVFIRENRWYAVRISSSIIPQLKYIAMFETAPVSSIRWIGEIKEIKPYKDTGKYEIVLEHKEEITPIKLDSGVKGLAPQSPRYSTIDLIKKAKKISEIW